MDKEKLFKTQINKLDTENSKLWKLVNKFQDKSRTAWVKKMMTSNVTNRSINNITTIDGDSILDDSVLKRLQKLEVKTWF